MQIITARLVLREFTPADIPAVIAYQRDPRYLRFYSEAWAERTDREIDDFVRMLIGYQRETPRTKFQLAIALPDGGPLIGNVGIRRNDANELEADIGYELDPRYWGLGYATEAARAIVAFGFSDLGLHRVSAVCIAENHASVAVLERVGLRREGVLREHEYFRGRWWDTLLWGLLDREWNAAAHDDDGGDARPS